MRGKRSFSASEINAIRQLLSEKERCDRLAQKALRHALRSKYRFFISDFTESRAGFGAADLDAVIGRGVITVQTAGGPGDALVGPESHHGLPVWEDLQARYKPGRVQVLLVGESPPAGGTFFYRGDSILYRAFGEAFGHPHNFLAEFQRRGFFLDDLVPFPVNHLARSAREAERHAHVGALAVRMHDYSPKAVVTVTKAIGAHVSEAMALASLSVPLHMLPFPGRPEHRTLFVDSLRKLLAL